MVCMHCLKDVVEYGPLGYCEQCRAWYTEEVEEVQGVFHYCTTKNSDPERCDKFVQSLIPRPVEIRAGEETPIVDSTLDNMRQADAICAACENKNFVLE